MFIIYNLFANFLYIVYKINLPYFSIKNNPKLCQSSLKKSGKTGPLP
jgi:hypothetical protein